MIKFEKTEILGWEAAIRGMRNPMNSWDKSDSFFSCEDCEGCYYEPTNNTIEVEGEEVHWCNHVGLRLGNNDLDLMQRLRKAGTDHRKFMRMLTVYVDITAPLYWWKEFDTYKVGTVANSCSTMHKIHAKEFTIDDFSVEHLLTYDESTRWGDIVPLTLAHTIVDALNMYRSEYLRTKDKEWWWQMIQLLPTSYNQKRTVMLNYEVLANIYKSRKNHKLDEWHDFCDWATYLPYAKELICNDKTNAM